MTFPFLLQILTLLLITFATSSLSAQNQYLTYVTDTAIYLRWEGYRQADLQGYRIMRSTDGGNFQNVSVSDFLREREEIEPILGYKTNYYFTLYDLNPNTNQITDAALNTVWGDAQNRNLFDAMALTNPTTGHALGEIYVDSNIQDGATYRYRIMVLTENGITEWLATEPVECCPPDEIPPVEYFTASPTNEGALLKWPRMEQAISNGEVVTFQVYRSESVMGPFEPANLYGIFNAQFTFGGTDFSGDSMNYKDKFLTNGNTYYYKIRSVNAFGLESKSTETKSVTPTFSSSPSPPVNLNGEPFGSGIRLRWAHPRQGQVAFEVFRAVGSGDFEMVSGSSGFPFDTSTTYLDFEVKEGGTYHYFVQALSQQGQASSTSDTFRINIPDKTPPPPPQNITATAEEGRIIIRWNAVDDNLRGYQVFRASDAAFESEYLLHSGYWQDTVYIDTLSPKSQTTYGYKVRATDQAYNHSPFSQMVKARMPDRVAPPAPVITRINQEEKVIRVNHSGVLADDLATFRLYRMDNPGDDRLVVDEVNSQTLTDTLEEDGVYYYVVTAIDEAGNESEPSERLSTKYEQFDQPLPPRNGTAEFNKNGIVLRWEAPQQGPVAGYVVVRENPNGSQATVAEIEGVKGYCRDMYVKQKREYTYTIKTRDERWRLSNPLIVEYKPEEE